MLTFSINVTAPPAKHHNAATYVDRVDDHVPAWLKYLENQSSRQPNPADPMATYSFEWMWHELGVIELRQ
ncbi:hypothetical protein JOH51_007069 [Rhizobium leguminosarum]|nr:hypothetical protein [Rhizobium leguminosarum]